MNKQQILAAFKTHAIASVLLIPIFFVTQIPTALATALIGISLPITVLNRRSMGTEQNNKKIVMFLLFSITLLASASLLTQYTLSIGLLWSIALQSVPMSVIVVTISIISLLFGLMATTIYTTVTAELNISTNPLLSIASVFITSTLIGALFWQLQPVIAPSEFAVESGAIMVYYSLVGFLPYISTTLASLRNPHTAIR